MLVAALGSVLFAQEPPQDTCTKETQGKLWPSEANSDRQIARRLIQSGELYMCAATTRTRRWQLVGIHIRTLEAAVASRKKDAPASNDRASFFAFHAWLSRH